MNYNRLLEEYQGTLEGILAWDIPPQLKQKIEDKIKELKAIPPKSEIFEGATISPMLIDLTPQKENKRELTVEEITDIIYSKIETSHGMVDNHEEVAEELHKAIYGW